MIIRSTACKNNHFMGKPNTQAGMKRQGLHQTCNWSKKLSRPIYQFPFPSQMLRNATLFSNLATSVERYATNDRSCMHDENGTGDGTHPYNGAWHAAQTKVPSESNLLYLPLPVHKKEVSNSRVVKTVLPKKSLAENGPNSYREAQFLSAG